MAAHWISLVFGVAFLQGVLSLSPLPVPDEEWEEFNRMMRDSTYRLPTTTRPHLYEISITPYFENVTGDIEPFTFDGQVAIYINATQNNVDEIIMHCSDMTISALTVSYTNVNNVVQQIVAPDQNFACEMPRAFLRIRTTEALQLGQEYTIRATYRGIIQSTMRGFYRSWYVDASNQRRWMGTTQFQPGNARSAFPCYDEPGFKAFFDITIHRERDFSPSISNMPIRTTVDIPTNERISETFHTTPWTSTYLVAFIVSHYEVVSTNNDPERPFDIYARNNAGYTGNWSLEIGELLLVAMENYTQIPYFTMAPYIDMKQAAIPDFSAGAMENWGLLTYREALILYDPENSNHFYKQRVANIVSHEIVHMWFGNLVTCAWWDNLWLNEGFARFYQYYLTGSVAPDLGFATRFIVEQKLVSKASDSVDTAHALTNPFVNDPSTVSNHFSTITYARGASILLMTQYLLGVDTYVKGLRYYLERRQFDVAEPHHLFTALDDAALEDNALAAYPGITINRYFRTWSEKAGHPVLTVNIDHSTGRMTVTQARWERTTGVSAFPGLWDVPITWTRAGDADFEDLKPTQFITSQTTILERGTEGNEWVVFNKQSVGFYRVNYDERNWALITLALRDNPNVIHEYNRAQIIDDLFNFGRAGVLPYERVFNIISFLEFDDQYAPWIAAIDSFAFVLRRLAHDPIQLGRFQKIIGNYSTAITRRLGYSEIPDEPYMDGLLRMYVMNFLCDNGHEECIANGKSNFQAWRNGASIPANMRPWVYCTGLREGNADDFNYFWSRYVSPENDLASEQVVMLQAAGCTSDEGSLRSFLDAVVSDPLIGPVRPQDFTTALNNAVGRNEFNTLRVLNWLKENIPQTNYTLGSISTVLSSIGGRLLNENDIQEYEAWLNEVRDEIGPSYNTGINGVNTARSQLAWSAQRMPEFIRFFDIGYVDDDISDPTTTTTTTTTTTPPPPPPTEDGPTTPPTEDEITTPPTGDGDNGSASIATLSAFTLLITLAVNLVN